MAAVTRVFRRATAAYACYRLGAAERRLRAAERRAARELYRLVMRDAQRRHAEDPGAGS